VQRTGHQIVFERVTHAALTDVDRIRERVAVMARENASGAAQRPRAHGDEVRYKTSAIRNHSGPATSDPDDIRSAPTPADKARQPRRSACWRRRATSDNLEKNWKRKIHKGNFRLAPAARAALGLLFLYVILVRNLLSASRRPRHRFNRFDDVHPDVTFANAVNCRAHADAGADEERRLLAGSSPCAIDDTRDVQKCR
jgi:hypothetical protein